ncbi:RINT-1 family protein [Rhizoctonia solani AG-3 Rhs1AP]|uniref:RINT-1 family protein n=2 Tax=Rhizoctonia solani AG-3 TaxID=1086053 RepID=A0A074T0F0_9AGAM|nr:RINT-1 family protein [Rhizoctonia solani AG-3 Rhs1AP]KEP55532.1 RINT-1 family protein [Rhizoctonia solani 123E]
MTTAATSVGASAPTIEFIFHGTGTSSSLPNIACITSDPITCETCGSTLGPAGQKNKRRNTGGILRVLGDGQSPNRVIVIDVGKTFLSAAYDLFPRYGLRRIDAVILTHPHADAMNGLDDLRGWTLGKSIQAHIDIYVSAFTFKEVQRSFPYLVAKEFATGGGDVPEFRWHIIKENEPFRIMGVDFDITPIVVHHGRLFMTTEGDRHTPNDTPIPSGTASPAKAQFNSGTPKSSSPGSQRNSIEISAQGDPVSVDAVNMAALQLSPTHKPITRLTLPNQAPTAKPKPYLCFGFIFGDFMVYMSDVSHIPNDTWETIQSNSPGFGNQKNSGSSSGVANQTGRYRVLVVDCLRLEPHTSHFGIQGAFDAAKRVNAHRTYMVGFGHRIPHDDWNSIGEYLEGRDMNEKQLERPNVLGAMGILPQGGEPVWIRPAYDGLRLLGNKEEIKTLLSPPDVSLSETRALEYLDSNFVSWESIEQLSRLDAEVERTRVEAQDLEKRLGESQQLTYSFISTTNHQTKSLIDYAQELSLKRHLMVDEISALHDELVPANQEGATLLSELEELQKRLKELEGAKSYLQVLERALELSERGVQAIKQPATDRFSTTILDPFKDLSDFVSRANELLTDSSGSEIPMIARFLGNLRSSTWKDIKGVFTNRLAEASEKLGWPLPINLPASSVSDVEAFQQTFVDLLSLQAEGEAIQARSEVSDNKNERDGLYSLEALVLPIALRFKFHFDSTRPTSRLDKPEWYFTHILNISHEHRGFIEHFIQPLIDKSPFHDINAQNEFTRLLFPILARKIRKSVPQLLAQPSLLAHTIYQSLLFDAAVRESGFTLVNTWECRATKQHKAKEWPGVADVVLSHKSWFDEWMEAERHFTEHQYNEIIISPDAFAFSNDGNEDFQQADIRPTNSARRIKALLEQVTERYQPLPHYNQRARFLITVQVPILEAYYGRISSSLDAFETLSSSFVRAVPGALAGQVGAGVDARKLTSGHEGLQRLLKAYASAFAIKSAMQEWGDSIFFLELWTEINEKSALRAKVDAHPSLPHTTPASTAEEIHGTLFDELISQYVSIVTRAEDMIIRHVCSEVEVELKGYFAKQWESGHDNDDNLVAIPATLVSPLTTLTTHLSLLVKTLPSSATASLYRRIASSIASHILQRSVFHFGRGRMIPSRGVVFAREAHLWVEASQLAMPNRRVEGPWQRLLDGARLVSIPEGADFEAAKDTIWRASNEQCAEFAEAIGVRSLDRKEMQDALRARSDW